MFYESLCAVARGEALQAQPQVVQRELLMWRWVPTNETRIEAKHAHVALSRRPTLFSALATAYGKARDLRAVPSLLGLDSHPWWRRSLVCAHEKRVRSCKHGYSRKVLKKGLLEIVFHCVESSMLEDMRAARQTNAAAIRRSMRTVDAVVGSSNEDTSMGDAVRMSSIIDHFRWRLQRAPDAVFTIPKTAVLVKSIGDHFQAQAPQGDEVAAMMLSVGDDSKNILVSGSLATVLGMLAL